MNFLKAIQLIFTKHVPPFYQLSGVSLEIKRLKTSRFFVAMVTNKWGNDWVESMIKLARILRIFF